MYFAKDGGKAGIRTYIRQSNKKANIGGIDGVGYLSKISDANVIS